MNTQLKDLMAQVSAGDVAAQAVLKDYLLEHGSTDVAADAFMVLLVPGLQPHRFYDTVMFTDGDTPGTHRLFELLEWSGGPMKNLDSTNFTTPRRIRRGQEFQLKRVRCTALLEAPYTSETWDSMSLTIRLNGREPLVALPLGEVVRAGLAGVPVPEEVIETQYRVQGVVGAGWSIEGPPSAGRPIDGQSMTRSMRPCTIMDNDDIQGFVRAEHRLGGGRDEGARRFSVKVFLEGRLTRDPLR